MNVIFWTILWICTGPVHQTLPLSLSKSIDLHEQTDEKRAHTHAHINMRPIHGVIVSIFAFCSPIFFPESLNVRVQCLLQSFICQFLFRFFSSTLSLDCFFARGWERERDEEKKLLLLQSPSIHIESYAYPSIDKWNIMILFLCIIICISFGWNFSRPLMLCSLYRSCVWACVRVCDLLFLLVVIFFLSFFVYCSSSLLLFGKFAVLVRTKGTKHTWNK